jgi:hypothetical protein
MKIFDRDKIRIQLLIEVYNRADGDTTVPVSVGAIGELLKIEETETIKAYSYLIDEMLIKPYGMGSSFGMLTHAGLKEAESIQRKIDFNVDISFNTTEIFQLRIILDEIKQELNKLHLSQEIIYNSIDETFEKSKTKTKLNWKEYFEGQVRDWSAQKLINSSAEIIMRGILVGLKIQTE